MTDRTWYKISTLFILVFIVSCTQAPKIYMEKGLVTGQPGMNVYTSKSPGETEKLERPYEIAPPLVPHDVTEFTVDRSLNECFECHAEGLEVDEGHVATKIPVSHYLNEFTNEQTKDMVAGIRYVCLQCHVPQTE